MRCRPAIIVLFVGTVLAEAQATEDKLIAHWPLAGDGQDISGHRIDARPHRVDFSVIGRSGRAGTAAGFDGGRTV